jgi:hypothetical protein
VQVRVAEVILSGRNCCIEAPCPQYFCEGMTTAMCIAVAQRPKNALNVCQALILCPHRELALQTYQSMKSISAARGLGVAVFLGGTPIRENADQLQQRPDVVVGTPGRIRDLRERRMLDLSQFAVVVVRDLDHSIQMGFQADLNAILITATAHRQFVGLCSGGPLDADVQAFLTLQAPEATVLSGSELEMLGFRATVQHYKVVADSTALLASVVAVCSAIGPMKPLLILVDESESTEVVSTALREAGIPAVPSYPATYFENGKPHFQIAAALTESWKRGEIRCVVVNVSDVDALSGCTYFAGRSGLVLSGVVAVNLSLEEDWSFLSRVSRIMFCGRGFDEHRPSNIVHVVDSSHCVTLDRLCESTSVSVSEVTDLAALYSI